MRTSPRFVCIPREPQNIWKTREGRQVYCRSLKITDRFSREALLKCLDHNQQFCELEGKH